MQRRRAVDTYVATLRKAERDRCAQRLLETTDLSVEQVAAEVGFGSAAVLRVHFGGVVCTSPVTYRRAFSRAGRATAAHRRTPTSAGVSV